jgi:hypothetical protein
MTKMISQDAETTVWMNAETFLRFWQDAGSNIFECADGMKFRDFSKAEAHAAKK